MSHLIKIVLLFLVFMTSCTEDKNFSGEQNARTAVAQSPTPTPTGSSNITCQTDETSDQCVSQTPTEVDCTGTNEAECADKKGDPTNPAPSYRVVDCAGVNEDICKNQVAQERITDGKNQSEIRVTNCLKADATSCNESAGISSGNGEIVQPTPDGGINQGGGAIEDPQYPEVGYCSAGPQGRVQSAFVTAGEASNCAKTYKPLGKSFACKCQTGNIGGGCRTLDPKRWPNGMPCLQR